MELIQLFQSFTATWVCGCFIIIGTWLSGYPFLSLFNAGGKGIIRHIIGLIAGISILSLSGILCEFLRIEPLFLQWTIIITGFCIAVYLFKRHSFSIDTSLLLFFIPVALFCIVLWTFFSFIGSWMGGDAVAHASIIQLLIEKQHIPVSLPPIGSYWEYYPKGFHLYAYPFSVVTGVMPAIQTIPVFLTTLIPLSLAALFREWNLKDAAWFTLIGGLICVPQVWAALIWGGYPSLTAGVLICGGIVSFFVDKRLIVLFGAALLIVHTRELAILIAALTGIIGYHHYLRNQSNSLRYCVILVSFISIMVLLFLGIPSMKGYLVSSFSDPGDIAMQLMRWAWVFPACIAATMLLGSENKENKVLFGWVLGISFFLLGVLATSSINTFPLTRILTDLAIPLTGFFGISIAAMIKGGGNVPGMKWKVTGLLLLVGIALTGGTTFYYYTAWALPSEDRDAMEWLSEQGFSKGIVINIDETGGLAYPMAGISVSHPRVVPGLEITDAIYSPPWNISYLTNVEEIREKTAGYDPVLLYISSVSRSRPGYSSPFSEYPYPYPNGSVSLPSEYKCIYDKGAQVYAL